MQSIETKMKTILEYMCRF